MTVVPTSVNARLYSAASARGAMITAPRDAEGHLAAPLELLLARTAATFVSLYLLGPRGQPRGAVHITAEPRNGSSDRSATVTVSDALMAAVHSRKTLRVEKQVMATPITRGARLEGSLWVGKLGRTDWAEEHLADLVETRRAVEELLGLPGRNPGQDPATQDSREVIGVLGGMGPAASAEFIATLTRVTSASRDQDHLRVLLDSNPQIPDRTAFLLGHGPDPRPALLAGARGLRRAGATCVVIPCNTANIFAPYLARQVPLSVVPWIPTATAAVPGRGPVGVLATEGTLRSGLYQRALRMAGRTAVLPTEAEGAQVMRVIYAGAKQGTLSSADRAALVAVAIAMVKRGAEQLLLACTEIPLVLPADADAWPVPATDPAIAVARRLTRTHEPDGEESVRCSSTIC